MKIERIHVVNFLSHADTTFDMRGLSAFVVIGKNGAGKSGLIVDAPLVALFGKGRDSDLDDFIMLGKDAMIDELDFSVDSGTYRVVRKRSRKTARGSSLLEMYLIDGTGQVIKEMTQGTIADTQMLVEKTIGVDYDTLVRTSVIEQTEAEKFCLATPSERMDLLAKIWDLEKYDGLGQLAKEERIVIETTVKGNDEKVNRLFTNVENAESRQGELATLRKDVERKSHVVKEYEAKKAKLQEDLTRLETATKELLTIEGFIKKVDSDIKSATEQHEEVMKKIGRFDKILRNKQAVYDKVTEEAQLVVKIEGLEKSKKVLDDEIELIRLSIDEGSKWLSDVVSGIEKDRKKVAEEIEWTDAEISKLKDDKTMLARREEALASMKREASKLEGIKCHPETDMFYINENCRFIKDAVIARDKMGSEETDVEFFKNEIKRIAEDFEVKKSGQVKLRESLDKSIQSEKDKLDLVTKKKNAEIKEKSGEKSKIDGQMESVKKELVEVKKFTVLVPEITLSEKELPILKTEERKIFDKTNTLLNDKKGFLDKKEGLNKRLEGKEEIESQLQVICNSLDVEKKAHLEMAKNVGFVEQMVSQIEPWKKEIKEIENDNGVLTGNKAILQILEDAYKAIPYMVISRGIGAVENKANAILAEISQSGLRVEVKTAKVTKTTKKLRDDLHLVITDQDGEKKYRMLSGGERLRVAMALRLAISEVLAHRRAVRIESLTADEPFSALDVEGVEDMKECMRSLKNRFKVMGVVTHDERAKDLFPVQIEVVRGKLGAELRISGDYA